MIEIPSLGLSIYTSPKVLSTSLKSLAFELENQRTFEPFIHGGRVKNVHNLYPAKPFRAPDRARFSLVVAFVRDPVERLKSAYRDRVVRRHGQSAAAWRRAVESGLPEAPGFGEFVDLLEAYRLAIPEIDHHCAPQVHFLGRSPQVFDRVFNVQNVGEFESLVSERAKFRVQVPRTNRSKQMVLDPSPTTLQKIHHHFADDYIAFEGLFEGGDPRGSIRPTLRPSAERSRHCRDMRLILHVGRPKTGTTSLQKFLRVNRSALSRDGFLLFDGIGAPNNIEFAAYFASVGAPGVRYWRARRRISTEEDLAAHFAAESPLDRIAEQVRAGSSDHHTAIITSEQLSGIGSSDALARIAGWAQGLFDAVTVVVFVRDQADAIVSSWSTSLRSGGHKPLPEFARARAGAPANDLFRFANRWVSAFGRENVKFHVYRSGSEGDVRRTFAHEYLVGGHDLRFPAPRMNAALTRPHAEVLRLINRAIPYWPAGRSAPNRVNRMARWIAARVVGGRGPGIRLDPAEAARIRSSVEESNARFAAKFLRSGEVL